MSTTVSDKGGFVPCPEGNWISRCYGIVDVGNQYSKYYEKWSPKIFLLFEILDEGVPHRVFDGNDEGPELINAKYTASLGEKSMLRKNLEQWRGKKFTTSELEGFNLKKLLGQYCLTQIIHSDDGKYANISSIATIPASMKKNGLPNPVNSDLFYDMDDSTDADFQALPEWLQKMVMLSQEKQDSSAPTEQGDPGPGPNEDFEDDIPF